MSYNYASYTLALQTLMVSQAPDVDFTNIEPSAIDYAEQRCYRELNLLNTVQTDSSTTLANGVRSATIPSSFIVVNNMNVLTPAGTTDDTAVRKPLVPVSRDVIDNLWPSNSSPGVPQMFAMVDQWSVLFGPAPDDAYALEVIGTYRPAPLSAANPTTFLSTYLPDLFLAASMVFMSGYMRNFGAQMNDPAMSSSWETQYQTLFKSAETEEARKHFWASSWTAYPVASGAQPQRG